MEIFANADNKSSSIGTGSTEVLVRNTKRNFASFVNDSDAVIYLSLGSAAVLNKGIRLNASGGSFELDTNNLYLGAIYAIHGGSGNKNLCVVEGE